MPSIVSKSCQILSYSQKLCAYRCKSASYTFQLATLLICLCIKLASIHVAVIERFQFKLTLHICLFCFLSSHIIHLVIKFPLHFFRFSRHNFTPRLISLIKCIITIQQFCEACYVSVPFSPGN